MAERVLVAMSGGVDSSVAAAKLKQEGFDVVGVTLHLWDYPDDGSVKGRCCAPEDVHDARRVADKLGFKHFAFDRRELFEKEVVTPFVESYLKGETPSPCVRCNRGVKVDQLVALADRLGARSIATGHYVRIVENQEGSESRLDLLRATDLKKDQSYFLHMLPNETLRRFVFPLGGMDKPQVRKMAVELDLPGAKKGESQELCFVPTGRYDELVEKRAKERLRPGKIVDESGRELGQHPGLQKFTRGQRRGLGVSVGARTYVVDLDEKTSTVVLGPKERLECRQLEVGELALRDGVSLPFEADVVVRYHGKPSRGRVIALTDGRAKVELDESVMAPSVGQFAVFYEGDRVLGGGAIETVAQN